MAGKEGVVRELGQVYWHSPIPPAFMSIETVHLNAYTMADEPKPGSRGVRVQRMKGTTMTDPVYKGACMCGAVRFEARGEPLRTGMCHCTTCRRNTGSAFTVYAVFPAARLRMLGDETGSYATSEHLTRHFCRVCGAPAFVEERGEMIRALGRFRRRGSVHAHLRAVRGQPAPVAAAGARPRILRARPRLGSGPINFLFSIFADDDDPVQGGHHMSDQFWLTRAQLKRLEPHFPLSHGIPRVDDLRVVSGIIHVIRNGLRWRDAPKDYGPHKTLYNRFVRWSRLGVFDRIFASLAGEGGTPDQLMIDATHLKAHRTAASLLKKGMFPAVSDARKAA